MPDNFASEKVSSADQIFATDFRASDSAHFPIGKLAHGALNTFTLTTTSDPFPVKLFGNDSTAPVHFTTDSGAPPKILVNNDSTDLLFVSDSATPVFVRGLTDSHVAITNDSGNPVFVRGLTNSIVDVLVTNTNITVTNIADNDTTVTVTGSSVVTLNGLGTAAGALTATVIALSSLMQSPMSAVGRLYGYSASNPDTVANIFLHVYTDDSAGITLGTTSAAISAIIPFGGGANISFPQGINMSSGMTVTAAATANSTSHDAPATTAFVTLWYTPST